MGHNDGGGPHRVGDHVCDHRGDRYWLSQPRSVTDPSSFRETVPLTAAYAEPQTEETPRTDGMEAHKGLSDSTGRRACRHLRSRVDTVLRATATVTAGRFRVLPAACDVLKYRAYASRHRGSRPRRCCLRRGLVR